jgi:hypothetical protein
VLHTPNNRGYAWGFYLHFKKQNFCPLRGLVPAAKPDEGSIWAGPSIPAAMPAVQAGVLHPPDAPAFALAY